MPVFSQERGHVRELARCVAELAAGDMNRRIQRRWRDVNALRRPDRAPVWCRPVGAWGELLPETALRCTDPWLRGIERGFQQILIKHAIGDDSPVDAFFPVAAQFDVTPKSIWGVDVRHRAPGRADGAWAYDPPLKTPADFIHLAYPVFRYNHERTQESLDRADALLGDILTVKRVCDAPLSATLGTAAADLLGLDRMMLNMVEAPDVMHWLMAHLRDSVLRAMDRVEETGLLTPNNTGPMTCSDSVGSEPEGKLTYGNLWVSANSQEFDGVSPTMWEEFLLQYQRPILDRFGLACYGCCENLTHKIEGVLSIPNLRIFVCSAWTDLEKVVERVGTRHVIMWRQKASDVVFADDPATLKRGLEEGLRRLKGCHVQIVLRELQTLAGHPDRLHVWTRLAQETAAKFA